MDKPASEAYRIERLSEQGLGYLIELYAACFGAKTNLEFLKKKYDTGVFGASYLGYLAFDAQSGDIAAYYGVFPLRASYQGKELLVAQSGDTMTHPKHQGKGLFVRLAKATYELAKTEGVHFVFGFPNENSYPGFVRKLDWQHHNNIKHYYIPVGKIPMDKLAVKFRFLASPYQWFVKKRLAKYHSTLSAENAVSQLEKNKGFITYDSDFIRYKRYYPHYQLCVNGIACTVKVDGRLWLANAAVYTKEQLEELIRGLKKLSGKIGVSNIHISAFEPGQWNTWMESGYPVKSTIAVGYLNLSMQYDPAEFVFQAYDFDTF